MGEPLLIEGSFRQGQAKALTRQKNSDNIENVVSEDLIESFPDPNVTEAVQRLPGITIQRDQGEGRYIQVRGLAPRLNTVAVNGVKIPSPEGEVRQVAMDVVGADLLASIELH
jgi:outer membrane receptor for ferrienterochelin and colicin